MPISLKTIHRELQTLKQEVEFLRVTVMPEETLNKKEQRELKNILQEMKKGKEEDEILDAMAQQRDTKNARYISHAKAWQQSTK